MHDVHARVGGYNDDSINQVGATAMFIIHSGNVVIDNAWLWRADHSASGPVVSHKNPVESGLFALGTNITAYGLAVENTQKNQVHWSGDGGNVWFYQSTLPLDADSTWAANNYVAYHVHSSVLTHSANGVGAYSNFRDNIVEAT